MVRRYCSKFSELQTSMGYTKFHVFCPLQLTSLRPSFFDQKTNAYEYSVLSVYGFCRTMPQDVVLCVNGLYRLMLVAACMCILRIFVSMTSFILWLAFMPLSTVDGGGIMFSGCPSVCTTVRAWFRPSVSWWTWYFINRLGGISSHLQPWWTWGQDQLSTLWG